MPRRQRERPRATHHSAEVTTMLPDLNQELPVFTHNTIICRPLRHTDFEAYWAIFGGKTNLGSNKDEARFYFRQHKQRIGIFLKNEDGSESVIIGEGIVTKRDKEWPRVTYMLRENFTSEGYRAQFLISFLRAWWSLPRKRVTIRVEEVSLEPKEKETHQAFERLCAEAEVGDWRAERALRTSGYEKCAELEDSADKLWGFYRVPFGRTNRVQSPPRTYTRGPFDF